MHSGWAVLGDNQYLEGYSLLLADPVVADLNDLDRECRQRFLLDMSLLGEAVSSCTPAYRINYEILGNSAPALHAHVLPRFRDEPEELRNGPVWLYPEEVRASSPFSPVIHGRLLSSLRTVLERLLDE
jgi:diadenosine tetraphosphate (Ap4A) HIT family hydrolase